MARSTRLSSRRLRPTWGVLAALASFTLAATPALAQFDSLYEHESIAYSSSEPDNPVSRLKKKIEGDPSTWKHDEKFGWLPDLLRELQIDTASQTLVFSKTSLQRKAISPTKPRAVYFNDSVYIGYPNGGDLIEISVADPKLGAVFYSIDQTNPAKPILTRETETCLACHASSAHTNGVPGHMVRSVFTDAEGFPELSLGSFRTTPESPFKERWGGWYVTGKVGENPHLGNRWLEEVASTARPERFKAESEAVTAWPKNVEPSHYPVQTSDIVALLLLEHQVALHNRMTQSQFSTTRALWDEKVLDEAFGDSDDTLRGSTKSRIDRAAKTMVEELFCLNETDFKPGIEADPAFVKQFAAMGPTDSKGRSLRDLDLQTRLFRYPCSYLVYSEAFLEMTPELKTAVVSLMTKWLEEGIPKHQDAISPDDRQAILEILRETHPDFGGSSHFTPKEQTAQEPTNNPPAAPQVAPRPPASVS